MTNKEISEKVFDILKSHGFSPIDISYSNTYFVFDYVGDNGIVHFKIKKLKDWEFGMWLNINKDISEDETYPAIQFFCQHKFNVDKFKPSRSFFLAEISSTDIQSEDNWWGYQILSILNMIKRHPLISFAMDAHENPYHYSSYLGFYLKCKIRSYKEPLKSLYIGMVLKTIYQIKAFILGKYKIVDSVKLIDQDSDDWIIDPRFKMCIHFKKISEDESIQDNEEEKIVKRWFKKSFYQYMGIEVELTRDGSTESYWYD